MLSISHPVDAAPFPLGQRRGLSDVARIATDLAWTPKRAEFEISAPSRAYPSPPMSGSQPLPPKSTLEAGGREITGGYQTASVQDAYRASSTQSSSIDPRGQSVMTPTLPRPFSQELPDRMPYGYQRTEPPPSRQLPYPTQGISGMPQHHGYLPTGAPTPGAAYPVSSRPSTAETMQTTSPKSQRKTKGHVASACVPCKRAHLRCDAQRPCSRCVSNGKEDSCVDVQHKKRGRPRLRDDRDTRYDPSRFSHPQDVAMRRPLTIFPSGGSIGSGYEESISRMQSYRVLKSQPSDPTTPRFLERGSASDANIYAAPLSIATRSPEPVAFLDMNMDFAKISPSFMDAVGVGNILGRNLTEIVVAAERDKVLAIRGQLFEEQTRKEPNYLPPILARLDHIIQGLGFSPEDLGRFQLDRQEYLTFTGIDGHVRTYPLRLGLAKEGSIYFVVVVLTLLGRYPYPSPSPHARDMPPTYLVQPTTPQSAFAQHTPVSATFEHARRYSEGMGSRPAALAQGQATNLSPGVATGPSSYSASPSRSEYPGPSAYQIPRSELPSTARPAPQPAFQLPPIRAQPDQGAASGDGGWQREERSGRVDIEGLIDKPDPPRRPQ